MRASRAITLLLIALALLQTAFYGTRLPDPVASHFNGAGEPNGWSSRASFLILNLVFVLGMALIFLVLPPIVHGIPNDWINMPNKDYWLAPERREQTLATMQSWMEWLGAATLALLIAIFQMSIEANLRDPVQLGPGVGALTIGYLVVLVIWTVLFLRWAFQKPPAEKQNPSGI